MWLCVLVLGLLTGCRSTSPFLSGSKPLTHTVQTTGFVIRSDFEIADDSPMIRELKQLQADVVETLELPAQRDPVVVYLFSSEGAYRRHMKKTWPSLPRRRAYFIGTSRELAVYSFHGPRMQEDLRHELTHGILHATLKSVPLWLDEGLAEYFEVGGSETGAPHPEHLRSLQRSVQHDRTPSIARLEEIVDFKKFSTDDYAESWGWVHFMLHGDTDQRQLLIDYIHDLRDADQPESILARLPASQRNASHRLTSWVRQLHDAGRSPGLSL